MNIKKIFAGLVVSAAIFLTSCGAGKPSGTVTEYLKAECRSDYTTAYGFLSESDRNTKPLNAYTEDKKNEFGIFTEALRKSTTFKIIEENAGDNSATVKAEITADDYSSLIQETFGKAFAGVDSDTLKNEMKSKLNGNMPKTTRTETYNLIRESEKWVIILGYEKKARIKELTEKAKKLKEAGDFSAALSAYEEILTLNPAEEVASKEAKTLEAKIGYIPKITVYDFTSKYLNTGWNGIVPYIDFKIKNGGDKELKKVVVTVYFKDKNGAIIHEQKYYPVNKNEFFNSTDTLKPNHIWQQQRNFYYSADSLPSEWYEGAADIAITDIEFN